ncbi:Sh3 domain-containing protein c23a1.17-like [Plakobranchus ocellatus]|uniref:Sh3 domain-containing protein c23a1.17-like n=1 Tax=Plakobranchus ocellatus TaxID=259542 RepID=A0AAV4DM21_9GAST|nr:Sh3 domain-containing protein c23a1.17-like [Plakobranchus ocellatus]
MLGRLCVAKKSPNNASPSSPNLPVAVFSNPSTSDLSETQVTLSLNGSENERLHADENLRPFPKAPPRKELTKGRKRGRTAIVTGSPVKHALEEQAEGKGKSKGQALGKGKEKGKGPAKGKGRGKELISLHLTVKQLKNFALFARRLSPQASQWKSGSSVPLVACMLTDFAH